MGAAYRRQGSTRLVGHRLSEEERQRILLTCNQPEYAALPPGQIVPALADQKLFYSCGEDFVDPFRGRDARRRTARLMAHR